MKEVLVVREYEKNGEKKTHWTNIGTAFENRDGSLTVMLNALPIGNRLIIKEKQERKEGEPQRPRNSRVSEPVVDDTDIPF
jgi:hypothetical protein